MRLFAVAFLLVACNKGSDGEFVQVDPPGFNIPPPPSEPTCGATELCERSIDECGVVLEQAECEAWYSSGQCADIDAYTECNCACEAQAECDGYFACGEICFEDHC